MNVNTHCVNILILLTIFNIWTSFVDTTVPTTTSAAVTSGQMQIVTSGNTNTTLPGVSHKCAIALEVCSLKCNSDYLSDPKDCTFCLCKSELQGLM